MISRRTVLRSLVPATSILFMPMLTRLQQAPPSTTIPYNCDLGDTAFAAFYFPYPCTFFYSWQYIQLGYFVTLPVTLDVPDTGEIFCWFINSGGQQLQDFTWRCSGPAMFTFGTCII